MKRVVTVAFLILLAAGPASVWADALDCCSPEHPGETIHAIDGCMAPICCMASAPVPGRQSGQEQLSGAGAVQAPVTISLVVDNLSALADRPGGESSPAWSQTSPVLLR